MNLINNKNKKTIYNYLFLLILIFLLFLIIIKLSSIQIEEDISSSVLENILKTTNNEVLNDEYPTYSHKLLDSVNSEVIDGKIYFRHQNYFFQFVENGGVWSDIRPDLVGTFSNGDTNKNTRYFSGFQSSIVNHQETETLYQVSEREAYLARNSNNEISFNYISFLESVKSVLGEFFLYAGLAEDKVTVKGESNIILDNVAAEDKSLIKSSSMPNLIQDVNINRHINSSRSAPNLIAPIEGVIENKPKSSIRELVTRSMSLSEIINNNKVLTKSNSCPSLITTGESFKENITLKIKKLITRSVSLPENLNKLTTIPKNNSCPGLIPAEEVITNEILPEVIPIVNATTPEITPVSGNKVSTFSSIANRGMGIMPSFNFMARGAMPKATDVVAPMAEAPTIAVKPTVIPKGPVYSDIVNILMSPYPFTEETEDKQLKVHMGEAEKNDPRIGAIPKGSRFYYSDNFEDFDDIDAYDLNSMVGIPIYIEKATNKHYSYVNFLPAFLHDPVDVCNLYSYEALKKESPDTLIPVQFHRLKHLPIHLHLNIKEGIYYADLRELSYKRLILEDGLKPKDLKIYQDPMQPVFYNNEVVKSYFNFRSNSNLDVD